MASMKHLNRFRYLPLSEKFGLISAFLLVLVIRIGLWVLPFPLLQKLLSRITLLTFRRERENLEIVQKIVYFVRAASRFVPRATCLTQALTTLVLIRWRGQVADLKFGVLLNENKTLAAHAWLEKDGRIIIGKLPRHERFVTLQSTKQVVL